MIRIPRPLCRRGLPQTTAAWRALLRQSLNSSLRKSLLTGSLALLAACATPPAALVDPSLPAGDQAMAEAIADARRTLPDFFAIAAAPPVNTLGFRLRVSVSDGSRREFVWIMPFRQTADGQFEGTVAEQPAYLVNLVPGQTLRFGMPDIVDWGYTANGYDIGSRTVCVMLERMPPERAEALRREHRMGC